MRLIGGGVSATTCAHLLAQHGVALTGAAAGAASPPAPVVLLSDAALGLLRDLFGQPDLLASLPRISRRIVAWGIGETVTVPHDGAVATGAALAAALQPQSSPARGRWRPKADGGGGRLSEFSRRPPPPPGGARHLPLAGEDQASFFTIHAGPPPGVPLHSFGSRPAQAAAVHLTPGADRDACTVESVVSGWLFLIPHGDAAWLLGVGAALDDLLAESRIVAKQLVAIDRAAARFETAPRMIEQLSGPDWLALGTAAIAFDPICGDGTAQAAREAVLAAAVVTGLLEGGDPAALLGHYHAMLLAAMRRHLQIAIGFYSEGGSSPWWQDQAAATRAGYDWCTARLALLPEPRFNLHGARLLPRGKAA